MTRELALFFHLLGAFTLFSGAAVAAVAQLHARRCAEARSIALLLGLARTGVMLVGAGAVLILVFGFWLVSLERRSLDEGWLTASLALLALSFILGAAGGRRPRRARMLAAHLAAEGRPPTDELRSLLDDRPSAAANLLSSAAMIAIVALMVWKPA